MLDIGPMPTPRALLKGAPTCPECGGLARHIDVQRVTDYGEDWVTSAVEFYQCEEGHRYVRRFELDRITEKERELERDFAAKRIEWMREQPVFAELFKPRGWLYAKAQERWPSRPEPDLLKRYQEARAL